MLNPGSHSQCSDADLLTYRTVLHEETLRVTAEFPDPQDQIGPRRAIVALFPMGFLLPGAHASLSAWLEQESEDWARRGARAPEHVAELLRTLLIAMRTQFTLALEPSCWNATRYDAAFRRNRIERSADSELSVIVTLSFDEAVDEAALLRLLDE